MNLGLHAENRSKIIAGFTWTWLIGSIVVSAYFSFWLFPKIYAELSEAVVDVYFQTDSPSEGTIYFPNERGYREIYLGRLSDAHFFYFDACQITPLSQRPICDSSRNWKKIDLTVLKCKDIKSCTATVYILTGLEKKQYLADLNPKPGYSFSISDDAKPTLSDPITWGPLAQLPLFFFSLFLALKLGRLLGEFVFLTYEK